MNYEQANAVKDLAAPVNKVLEGLDVECEACAGTAIGVKKIEVKGKERHKWIDKGCPICNGTRKIKYSWTPQVGEWFVLGGVVYLIDIDMLPIITDLTIPILEWEEIERVLEKAGYRLEIRDELNDDMVKINKKEQFLVWHWVNIHGLKIKVKDFLGPGHGSRVSLVGSVPIVSLYSIVSRQEAVMKAVLELGKELNEKLAKEASI